MFLPKRLSRNVSPVFGDSFFPDGSVALRVFCWLVACLFVGGVASVSAQNASPAATAGMRVRPEFELSEWKLAPEPGQPVPLPANERLPFASDLLRAFSQIFGRSPVPLTLFWEGPRPGFVDGTGSTSIACTALTPGPDGRLYCFCGVGGATMTRKDGGTLQVPAGGAVLRCEPNGSALEIFCRGLSNVHALAFDGAGNLWAADEGTGRENEGRWLRLLEQGDYGWRTGWSNAGVGPERTPWRAERLWAPHFDGQPAWVLPPIGNIAPETWGVVWYPGVGFPGQYENQFFIANPWRRVLSALTMRPNGAGFMFGGSMEIVSGAAVRELAFGPDGGLVFLVQDVYTPAKTAKIYSLQTKRAVPDLQVQQVAEWLADGLQQKTPIDWRQLIKAPDERVRLLAEWRLTTVPEGESLLRDVALSPVVGPEPTASRVHAIWGLGIMARRAEEKTPGAAAKMLEPLLPLLEDQDMEVQAQAAHVLGELRVGAAYDGLIKALRSSEERVTMFAAEALGKLGRIEALPQLMLMMRDSGDRDPALRHAYVDALVGLHDDAAIAEAARSGSPVVRLVALLAMRELRRPEIAQFLQDEEPSLVAEAVRAIHDEDIAEALPQLAALIEKPVADETLMMRVLNANFRVGRPENASALAGFAARQDVAETLRKDARQLLGHWQQPPASDYVTGARQKLPARDPKVGEEALRAAYGK